MNFSEVPKNELRCVRLCGMIEAGKTERKGHGTVEKNQARFGGSGQLSKEIRRYTSSRLVRRLVTMMVALGLIPAALITGVLLMVSTRLLRNNAQIHAYDTLNQAYYSVRQLITEAESTAMGLGIDSTVRQLISRDNLDIGRLDRSELRSILDNSLRMNRSYMNMVYLETKENIVYTFAYDEKVSPYAIHIRDTDYEAAVQAKLGGLYWFDIVDDTFPEEMSGRHRDFIRCASIIYDETGEKQAGILSLFLKTSAFADRLANLYNLSDGQTILLLDREYRLICASGPVDDQLAQQIQQLRPTESVNSTVSLAGKRYVSSVTDVGQTGWHLLSLQPQAFVTQVFYKTVRPFLLPFLLLPFICVGLSWVFISTLYSVLQPLQRTMEKIREGDLTVRAPLLDDWTLDFFGQTLNDTLDRYQHQVELSAHQEALLTVSRLKLLRGQLSPHFLYNTLDCVNWMLIENGQMETSQVITDLGTLLRYSTNEIPEKVSLSQEIEIIRRYLSICKHRFEDNLRYEIHIEPGLEDYSIPRFLLQPIVENAVIHGIEKSASGGTVILSCYETADAVCLDVANDGPCIDDDTKRALKESFAHPEILTTHIGLSNVNERIRLSFGREYGLLMLDWHPRGTLIRAVLPRKEGEISR